MAVTKMKIPQKKVKKDDQRIKELSQVKSFVDEIQCKTATEQSRKLIRRENPLYNQELDSTKKVITNRLATKFQSLR